MKHLRSAPYHPVTNGEAGRVVQTVKRKMLALEKLSLSHKLATVPLNITSTPHATTGPAELFLSWKLGTAEFVYISGTEASEATAV